MSSVHTLIDDASGKPIPHGAIYYNVAVRPYAPGPGRMNVYQDTQSYIAALGMARRALNLARANNEHPPMIEISGRTHF